MKSDYLDVSNPDRLLAFFKFCDAANLARRNKAIMADEPNPYVKSMCVGVIESMRQQATERAIALFNPYPSLR